MKNIYVILLVVIVLAGVGGYLAMTGTSEAETGVLEMQLTDAPDNVDNVFVTISDVRVHKAVNENSSENMEENISDNDMSSDGWSTVVDNSNTYDLIALEDATAFLGSSELETGKYTQIRLEVGDASVVVDGEEEDLRIPSGSVKLVRSFDIEENTTTTLTLDFDAGESINLQPQGDSIMKPTIQVIAE